MKVVKILSIATLLLVYVTSWSLIESRPQSWTSSASNTYEAPETEGRTGCGYSSCPEIDQNKLNVHIIAHTHDDVGWLKTVDQYFYGTRKIYNKVGVEDILDSVIPQLVMDKTKRFVYVEMSFFYKWWQEQNEHIKSITRQLVNEGRLEFINGGWCMNDEATVSYHSTIEQMTLGLKFLNETFGTCGMPRVGWQIDPFGHTNEQASLFAQFGFDGMFFTRIGYKDKERRTRDKSLDLIWHGDRALPSQSGSIFTNIFRDTYETPLWCFDSICQDDKIVDNKKSYEYNVEQKGNDLIKYLRKYADEKLTNNLLIPFGGDFHFSAAGQNFKSFDRLIKFIRTTAQDINIFYSTPSCYQLAVYNSVRSSEQSLRLPEKYDDFMPYDSSATVWWSGYFTSRPSVKLIERETAQLLQVSRLISLSNLINRYKLANRKSSRLDWRNEVEVHETKCLRPLWEILGDLQHHDAVTGTEKQHVSDDYVRRVADATKLCARMITELKRQHIDEKLKKSPKFEQFKSSAQKLQLDPIYLEDTMFCRSLNISQCEALESEVDIRNYLNTKLFQSSKQNLSLIDPFPRSNLSHSVPIKLNVALPKELETKAVLVNIYNPLAKPASQMDVRLPCNGNCDLDKVRVIHLASNETLKLIRLPLPAGVARLPFRESHTNYEILFYATVPALGSTSFLISDENDNEIVDEEFSNEDSLVITDETQRQNKQNVVRARRIQRRPADDYDFEYSGALSSSTFAPFLEQQYNFDMASDDYNYHRFARDAGSLSSQQSASDRVVVKFDMKSGVITGLKRASDGSVLNITQKFGQYYPAAGHQPGAYIFRPNSSEPYLFDKPISFKMYKRQNGALIEIHQKWADWIWQTIRIDSKKNYIEFDYVVGPIPIRPDLIGREIITRYITNMDNDGVFFTDSNARQLLARRRSDSIEVPADTGRSFYPVVSTMMIRNSKHGQSNGSAEAVAVLVDRPQGGTSLNQGDLEFLIHRRLLRDDEFGVGEALNEPGEDGRGLVTRGKHRLFLKFQDQPSFELEEIDSQGQAKVKTKRKQTSIYEMPKNPKQNLTFEQKYSMGLELKMRNLEPEPTYLVYDQLYNDIRQESIKYSLKPLITFDRLRVTANEFLQLLQANNGPKTDQSLLNGSIPKNIHLLTLQAWNGDSNQLLIRLENLDNPLTVHPMPDIRAYHSLLRSHKSNEFLSANQSKADDDPCKIRGEKPVIVDIKYMITDIKITSLVELNLGANAYLADVKRLDWTEEQTNTCEEVLTTTSIKLGPRQIRTFLASFELA